VPSFTLFDASIGYDFAALGKQYEGLEARLNVANLFDKHYVAACNGYGTCSYGKRREISLKLNYTW
jgi:iron complex outermembrane receptor protein